MVEPNHLAAALRNCLDGSAFDLLISYKERTSRRKIAALLAEAKRHLNEVRAAKERNSLLDLRTAEAVVARLRVLAERTMAPEEAGWFKAVVLYFVESNDEENDLNSPIGFDDDLRVVEAFETALAETRPQSDAVEEGSR